MELLQQQALLREVDEEVRNDELKAMWNKYRVFILGAIFIAIFGAIGLEGFRYYQTQVILKDSNEYTHAEVLASTGKTKEALAAFEKLANEKNTGYAYLSMIRSVPLLEADGKKKEAISLLYTIKDSSDTPEPFKNAAAIALAFRLMDEPTPNVAEIKKFLEPLSVSSSPWSSIAQNILQLLKQEENAAETLPEADTSAPATDEQK